MDEASVVCEYVDEVAVKDGRPCILCTPAKSNTPRMARASLTIPSTKTLSDFDDFLGVWKFYRCCAEANSE